ncbi:hypothetical protein [Kingella oralis]|uniref:hypothetical protein n=1 Tax=Kingella oralis TaxID=505 RepID=UPI0034E3AD5D
MGALCSLSPQRQPENGKYRFQAAFCLSFARAGVSPLTTSRDKPLHPTQHQPFLA